MENGAVRIFNKAWVAIRCTALLLLLFAGAVKAFAFSHPVEVELHTEMENFRGSQEYERASREAYERVNEGSSDRRDLERALDYVNDHLARDFRLSRGLLERTAAGRYSWTEPLRTELFLSRVSEMSDYSYSSLEDWEMERAFIRVACKKEFNISDLIMGRRWLEKFFPGALDAWDKDFWPMY